MTVVPCDDSVGQRTALMRADPVDRRDHAVDVEERVDPALEFHLLGAARGQLVQGGHLHEARHLSRLPSSAVIGQAVRRPIRWAESSPAGGVVPAASCLSGSLTHRAGVSQTEDRPPAGFGTILDRLPTLKGKAEEDRDHPDERRIDRYDLVVIGGGMGGLAAASLAQRLGLRTALLEAHTKLGGCAGYFRRGPYTFDAGATALMGLRPGEPIGDLLDVLGVAFSSEPTRSYRMHLPDRRLDVVTDPARFVEASIAAFPAAEGGSAAGHRRFWRLQEAVGRALFAAAADVPRLPARGLGDLVHDLRILGPRGLLAAATSALTVQDVLNLLGLGRNAAVPLDDRHAAPGYRAGRPGDRAVRQRRGLPARLSERDEPPARRDARPRRGHRPAVRRARRRPADRHAGRSRRGDRAPAARGTAMTKDPVPDSSW